MRIAAAAFIFFLTVLSVAGAQVPAPESVRLFSVAAGKCGEMAESLHKREADLEDQAAVLDAERSRAKEGIDTEKSDEPESSAEETVDPELEDVEVEIGRLKELAAAHQDDKPLHDQLMGSIALLNQRRQQMLGSDEQVQRKNAAAMAANNRVDRINERIDAYNALARKFQEDVSRYKASCGVE